MRAVAVSERKPGALPLAYLHGVPCSEGGQVTFQLRSPSRATTSTLPLHAVK
jgi:hypothetical protein